MKVFSNSFYSGFLIVSLLLIINVACSNRDSIYELEIARYDLAKQEQISMNKKILNRKFPDGVWVAEWKIFYDGSAHFLTRYAMTADKIRVSYTEVKIDSMGVVRLMPQENQDRMTRWCLTARDCRICRFTKDVKNPESACHCTIGNAESCTTYWDEDFNPELLFNPEFVSH